MQKKKGIIFEYRENKQLPRPCTDWYIRENVLICEADDRLLMRSEVCSEEEYRRASKGY